MTITASELAAVFPANAVAREVLEEVAEATGTTVAQLKGPTRLRHIARARQLAMFKLREAGLTVARIGAILNRDHTTVIYGCQRIEALMAEAGAA